MTAEDTTTLTSARLDLWLWSVRIFKTRSLAADECKGGHVRVNDAPAKPSQKLKKGDVVRVRYPGWERVFKVEKLLVKRVGAPIAVTCYEDLSGPRPAYLSMPPVAKRDAAAAAPPRRNAAPSTNCAAEASNRLKRISRSAPHPARRHPPRRWGVA